MSIQEFNAQDFATLQDSRAKTKELEAFIKDRMITMLIIMGSKVPHIRSLSVTSPLDPRETNAKGQEVPPSILVKEHISGDRTGKSSAFHLVPVEFIFGGAEQDVALSKEVMETKRAEAGLPRVL